MKVLLAIDDSKFSNAAIQAVIAQSHSKDTEVRVLHVVEPPSLLVAREMGGYDPTLEAVWDEETKQAQALVAKTAETLRSHGMKVTTAVQQGDPKFPDGQRFRGNRPPCPLFRRDRADPIRPLRSFNSKERRIYVGKDGTIGACCLASVSGYHLGPAVLRTTVPKSDLGLS
jgi:hypothetical protein